MSFSSLRTLPREAFVVLSLVSGSHLVNHMYLVLFPPILGVLATEFDVTLATLGFAMGAQAFVNTAFQLPFGYLSDTYDRTLTLGLCLVLGGVGTLVLAAAPTFEWLLVGQVLVGVGVAGHHPSHYPLLSDATTETNRGRVFSVHGFAGNVGFAAPPVVIVAIMSVAGLTWRHAFGAIGALGLAYAVLAVFVSLRYVPRSVRRPNRVDDAAGAAASPGSTDTTGPTPSRRGRVRAQVATLLDSPKILALGLLALVASTAMWGITSFIVTLLEQGYGVESSTASLTLSVMFGVGAVFMLVGGDLTDRFAPAPLIAVSYALVTLFVLLLASFVLPPLAAVFAAVVGGSVGSLSTPARDKLADILSARADLGRNFAIVTVGVMVGNTVAPPLFGVLIETSGFRVGFASIAVVALGVVGLIVAIVAKWGDGFSIGESSPSTDAVDVSR
ncbi:MFS transporter [Haloprofundus halobius]|uniref:MFS transporter n=1 Tax=Haloprofundus halobius TaxID=2876194 RepID=UPI001CCC8AEE|nr:MFS transporter [Haloprofundus halobius]